LAVGFCPKNNGFAKVCGSAAPSPLARTPIVDSQLHKTNVNLLMSVCVFSLNVVNRCVRCSRGHRFCHECIGEWCLRKNFPGSAPFFTNPQRIPMAEVGHTARMRLLSEIRGSLRHQASYLARNTCPICRVHGPFRRDVETDTELLSMQVCNCIPYTQWLKIIFPKSIRTTVSSAVGFP